MMIDWTVRCFQQFCWCCGPLPSDGMLNYQATYVQRTDSVEVAMSQYFCIVINSICY